MSGKTAEWIQMPFGVVTGEWDRSRNGCIRWGVDRQGGKDSFGSEFARAFRCNQWGICCVVVPKCVNRSSCCLARWVGWVQALTNGMGVHVPQGEGTGSGIVCPHWPIWLQWRIFKRNVFDSCVKSWQYFRMDNTSLESTFPTKQSSSRSMLGFARNLQKCNSWHEKLTSHCTLQAAKRRYAASWQRLVVGCAPFWRGLGYFGSLCINLAFTRVARCACIDVHIEIPCFVQLIAYQYDRLHRPIGYCIELL